MKPFAAPWQATVNTSFHRRHESMHADVAIIRCIGADTMFDRQLMLQHHGRSVLTETEPSSPIQTFTYESGGGMRLIDDPAGRISQLVIEPQTVL